MARSSRSSRNLAGIGKKRINVASPKRATASKAAPVGSSLLDERSGQARTAKVAIGRGTFAPGFRPITNVTNAISQPRIVKQVDPQSGKGAARAGGEGRFANFNDRIVRANIMRVPKSGPQGTGGGPVGASRVVRPPRNTVRIELNGRARIRNV